MATTEVIYRNQQTVEQFKATNNASRIKVLDTTKTYAGSSIHKLMFTYGPNKSGYVAKALAEDIQAGKVDTSKDIVISEISQDGEKTWVPTMHYEGNGGYAEVISF